MHSAMLELIEEMEEENDKNIYLWNVVDGKTTPFLTPLENCYVPRLTAWYFDQTPLQNFKHNNDLQIYSILKTEYKKRITPYLVDRKTSFFNSLFGPEEWTWFT